MDLNKALVVVRNTLLYEDDLEHGTLVQLGWLRKELEHAISTKETQNTSDNIPSMPFIKQCTCGKSIATVHLCDECFRDAVTG